VIAERSGWAVRTLFGPIETWFEESFRTRVAANTVISDRLHERCVKLGAAPERILTMPNGCTPPRALSSSDRARARRDFGVEAAAPLFVHVGAMHRADAHMLFAAFRVVRAALPLARLVLIGNSRAPAAMSCGPGVSRTGYIVDSELARWLAAADAGVVVLRDNIASQARWPGKINDYFSAGLPVVIPRVGAAAEYVETYQAGRTSDVTPASFARAMIEIVADRRELSRAAERALALAGGVLSWSRVTDDLFSFYGRWCSGTTTSRTHVRMVSAT
jgi:glycosyltransferase involved in cell wall biosynthesis